MFLREVAPKLDGLSLGEIARTTGLSLAPRSLLAVPRRYAHPTSTPLDAFVALVAGDDNI